MSSALLQVATRLRANIFEMDGAIMTLPPTDSYGSYGGSQVQVTTIQCDLSHTHSYLLFRFQS